MNGMDALKVEIFDADIAQKIPAPFATTLQMNEIMSNASDTLIRLIRELGVCGHAFYPSQESFINAVLFIMHPNYLQSDLNIDIVSVRNHLIHNPTCSDCINLFLSKLRLISFLQLARLSSIHFGYQSINAEANWEMVSECAFMQLLYHPKMHKIIMKSLK